jgi:hypothetical protein
MITNTKKKKDIIIGWIIIFVLIIIIDIAYILLGGNLESKLVMIPISLGILLLGGAVIGTFEYIFKNGKKK